MSAFLTRLRVEVLPPSEAIGRQVYLLTEDFIYDSNILGRIVVPAGFKTDFASIPRIAWRYLDPEDPAILYISVVHDYLYSVLGRLIDGRVFTREQADLILPEGMEISGARIDQRTVAFRMVRWFGSGHWNAELKAA